VEADRPGPARRGCLFALLAVALTLSVFGSGAALALAATGQHVAFPYVAGSAASFFGLTAVGLSALSRGRLLGFAVTCLFLAAAALFLTRSADIGAAAEEARKEQGKAQEAKQQAEEALKQAEALKAEAALDRARVEDAPARAAKALEEAKALEKKAAATEARLEKERAPLEAQRRQLDTQAKAAAAEREKVAEEVRRLEAEKVKVEAARSEAAGLRKQAAAERAKAKEELEQAAQKAKESGQNLKRVEEALELIKGKLKSRLPAERHAALQALARVGDLAPSADYDLCAMVAFDPVPGLRKAALETLDKVQPKLYPVVVTLALPPERGGFSYVEAAKQLPDFGRAGLPLIAAQLQNPDLGAGRLNVGTCSSLLDTHAATLAAIASGDDAALKMLLALPESPLAIRYKASSPGEHSSLCQAVARHLQVLGKAKPEARKVLVPYFVKLLASPDADDRRQAADALGSFGPDAKTTLPVLKQMQLDPAEQVRNAVRDAIAKIEKADK
jgi:chemotaxis protein histidine kinase CheA